MASQPLASLATFWNLVQVRHIKYIFHYIVPFTWHVLVQVSTTSTSPRLSNRKYYPTFLRPVASDTSIAPGIVKLMQHFDWKHVAIITQEEDIFTLVNNVMILWIILALNSLHCMTHIITVQVKDLNRDKWSTLSWYMRTGVPYTHIPFSFFTCTQVFHGSQLCHFRLEMPLIKRWQKRGSILFILSVFQLIRTHN